MKFYHVDKMQPVKLELRFVRHYDPNDTFVPTKC